jgi:C4-dicarboxylate transporter/malic acid transport protein
MATLTAPARPVHHPWFRDVGPNWFATVMGTGIVANAAATLPVHVPGLLSLARAVWVLDVVLLLAVVAATATHWHHHPEAARGHLEHPVMRHFYGAPPMALLTVGAGALLVGRPVVGTGVAVALDAVLWTAGTVLGVLTAVAVPARTFLDGDAGPEAASGAWLMPVVPPMVSAATGPLLAPHLPPGQAQLTLLVVCAALFGLALVAAVVLIGAIWSRLAHHGLGAAAAVPTLWIVLGPLGQSVTAAHTIGALVPGVGPVVGLVYGVPVWGFALLWLAIVASVTARTARRGLPFSLSWWSFTFPVGTVVTGTSGLAAASGAHLFAVVAVVLYGGLVAAWAVVATRTLRGVVVAASQGVSRAAAA